ncbi:ribosome assembly factor SBDS [Candidatus Woesearchaeota archaeon]|nr:ribosome assembly factor SBDS [Candidatus Woesearchaeota archaeon]
MVDVEKAVIGRYRIEGENFEILLDCEKALELRAGKEISMDDVLAAPQIFSDAKKGLLASESQMKNVFGTADSYEVAMEIVKKGEIQVTAEHRKKMVEQKKRQIIDYIARNGVDPKTGYPHPHKRIELAMDEAKVHIDEYKKTELQVQEIMKMLRPIIPISFEKKEIAVRIPASYAAKGYSVVQGFAAVKQQDWQNDGSVVCVLELPAGMVNDLFDKLNNLTHGEVETKILKG